MVIFIDYMLMRMDVLIDQRFIDDDKLHSAQYGVIIFHKVIPAAKMKTLDIVQYMKLNKDGIIYEKFEYFVTKLILCEVVWVGGVHVVVITNITN